MAESEQARLIWERVQLIPSWGLAMDPYLRDVITQSQFDKLRDMEEAPKSLSEVS